MVRLSVIAWISIPYVLTIGGLFSLMFVGLGCISPGLDSLHLVRVDLSNLTATADKIIDPAGQVTGFPSPQVAQALVQSRHDGILQDFYDIALFGYCSGNKTANGFQATFCSSPKASFLFNPIDVWKLNSTNGTDLQKLLPYSFQTMLNNEPLSKWLHITYMVAMIGTVVELILLTLALYYTLGTVFAVIFALVFFLCASAASRLLSYWSSLVMITFQTSLKSYGVTSSVGQSPYVALVIASLFLFGAVIFWLVTSCCFRARSPYHGGHHKRRVTAEKAPYTSYERVSSPFAGVGDPALASDGVPLLDRPNQTYEPYRHF